MADPEMTDPQKGTEPDYKVERPTPKMTRQQKLGMGALLAGASLAALWTVWPSSRAMRARTSLLVMGSELTTATM